MTPNEPTSLEVPATFELPTELPSTLASLTPDVAVGIAVASVCFVLAVHNMLRGVWPEPLEKYRRLVLAATFLLIASWSAAGMSGINTGFWAAVNFGVFLLICIVPAWSFRQWFRTLPFPNQRFEVKGVGLVTVEEVSGETPLDAFITYKDAEGDRHRVSALRFVHQSEPSTAPAAATKLLKEVEP